jgi:hypothetical protein
VCQVTCTGDTLTLEPGVLYIVRGAPGRHPNTACRRSRASEDLETQASQAHVAGKVSARGIDERLDGGHGTHIGLHVDPSVVFTGGLRAPVGSRRGDGRLVKLRTAGDEGASSRAHDAQTGAHGARAREDAGTLWEGADCEFRIHAPRTTDHGGAGTVTDRFEHVTVSAHFKDGYHLCRVPEIAEANTLVHVRLSQRACSSDKRCRATSQQQPEGDYGDYGTDQRMRTEWAVILVLPGNAGQRTPRDMQAPWMALQSWGPQTLAARDVKLDVPLGVRLCLFCACELLPGWLNLDVQGMLSMHLYSHVRLCWVIRVCTHAHSQTRRLLKVSSLTLSNEGDSSLGPHRCP